MGYLDRGYDPSQKLSVDRLDILAAKVAAEWLR